MFHRILQFCNDDNACSVLNPLWLPSKFHIVTHSIFYFKKLIICQVCNSNRMTLSGINQNLHEK